MGKVGAPFGNKNGLIWTFEKSSELLDKAIELTNRKEWVKIDKELVEAFFWFKGGVFLIFVLIGILVSIVFGVL